MDFSIFFYILENTVFEKNSSYKRPATVSLITRKICLYNMESWHKDISKIWYRENIAEEE